MQLVILAAGMGSRFGGLKQMEPMDEKGNFLLDYSVYDAKQCGFDEVVFIIKKEFYEAFRDSIGKRVEKLVKVSYAFQDINDLPEPYKCPEGREKPWGTAHAIYVARDLIHDDFIIINGDDFYGRDAYRVAADYIRNGKKEVGSYANIAFRIKNTMTENGSVKRGVLYANKEGYLEKLVESQIEHGRPGKVNCVSLETEEKFEADENDLVSMNLFVFDKVLISHLVEKFPGWLSVNGDKLKSEFLIPTVIDELVHEGKATLKVLETSSKWFGVTYKEDKPFVVNSLKELVRQGVYKEGLY